MVLPVKEKTWQFNVGVNVYDATAVTNRQNLIFQLKNALVSFAQNPWVVVASSNRVTAGHDGADRWLSPSNINLSNAVGSWIVLQQSAISSNFQILLSCSNASPQLQTSYSHSGSYSGGTITAFPTAPDNVAVTSAASLTHSEGASIMNVMQSTDGYCTRAFLFNNNFPGQVPWYWCCEKLKNPTLGLSRDYVVGNWVDSNISNFQNSCLRYDYIMTARFYGTHITSTTQILSGTNEGIGNSIIVDLFQSPNDISGEYQIFPVSLVNTNRTMGQYYGRWGEFYDLWMGSVSNDLFYFRDNFNQSKQFIQLSNIILPWNGLTAVLA